VTAIHEAPPILSDGTGLQARAIAAARRAIEENTAHERERAAEELQGRQQTLLYALRTKLGLTLTIEALAGRDTATIEGLTFRTRRDRDYGRVELEVQRLCAKCTEPGWSSVMSLEDLGALLENAGWSHEYPGCPAQQRLEEDGPPDLGLERPPVGALPKARPTHGEQLVELIRSIALDALRREE
jgi:hypothetical protein